MRLRSFADCGGVNKKGEREREGKMKKLMIAATAAMIGMVASAATVNWSGNQALVDGTIDGWLAGDPVTLGPGNWQVLIFDSAVSGTSFAEVQAALAGGDKEALGDLFGNNVGTGKTAVEGAFAVEANMIVGGNNKVNGFAVFLDAENLDNANYAFLLQEHSATKGAAGTDIAVNNIDPLVEDYNGYLDMTTYKNGAGSGANWYALGASPSPEPTSGLLLLLGVAGRGLRRRRA